MAVVENEHSLVDHCIEFTTLKTIVNYKRITRSGVETTSFPTFIYCRHDIGFFCPNIEIVVQILDFFPNIGSFPQYFLSQILDFFAKTLFSLSQILNFFAKTLFFLSEILDAVELSQLGRRRENAWHRASKSEREKELI